MSTVEIQQDVRPLADVQDLVRLGQERGYVTSEEVMALVDECDMTLEEIEDLYTQLFDQSIEIYEQNPVTQGVLDTIEPTLDLSIQTVSSRPSSPVPERSRARSPSSPSTKRSSSPGASRWATSGPRTA